MDICKEIEMYTPKGCIAEQINVEFEGTPRQFIVLKNYKVHIDAHNSGNITLAFEFNNFPHDPPPGFHITSSDYNLKVNEDGSIKDLKPCNQAVTKLGIDTEWFYMSRPYSSNYKESDWNNIPVAQKNMQTYIEYVQSILNAFFQT